MPELLIERVNIYLLPTVDAKHSHHGSEVTIGDLHGNAMKLIFMLAKHGIATIGDEDHKNLAKLYCKQVDELTKEDLELFNTILGRMTFNNKIAIRLIGDELADRGSNDYFTLKILKKLHQAAVPVEILISNHSIEFVQAYQNQKNFAPPMLAPGGKFTPQNAHGSFAPSLENLQKLIDKGLVDREEILEIAKETYMPTLKAISYSLDEDGGITIYSHAPIGLQNIKAVAEKFQVSYTDDTPQNLAKTIDAINVAFHEKIKDKALINNLYKSGAMEASYAARRGYESPEPLVALMWNRCYALERPKILHGFPLRFGHGHDQSEASPSNVYNLDNTLGKSMYFDANGVYTVLYAPTSRITAIPIVPKTEEVVAAKTEKEQESAESAIVEAKTEEAVILKAEAEVTAEEAVKKAQQDAEAERERLEAAVLAKTKEEAKFKAQEAEEKAKTEAVRLEAEKEAADKKATEEAEKERQRLETEKEPPAKAEKAKKETEETVAKTKTKKTRSKAEKKANAIEEAEISFLIKLYRILQKAEDLKKRGHDHASRTALTLYHTIHDKYQTFSHSAKKPADVTTFEKECLVALQKSRPELEKHRGWKEVLYNIMLAIIGIGFIYGIAVVWNGGLFRLKTDSRQKLDTLDEYLKEFTATKKQQRSN